jgi:hypothetical protein
MKVMARLLLVVVSAMRWPFYTISFIPGEKMEKAKTGGSKGDISEPMSELSTAGKHVVNNVYSTTFGPNKDGNCWLRASEETQKLEQKAAAVEQASEVLDGGTLNFPMGKDGLQYLVVCCR